MTRKKFRDLAAPLRADPVNRLIMDEIGRAMDTALILGRLRDEHAASAARRAHDTAATPKAATSIKQCEGEYLAALRAYVEDLGGTLEIAAVFPDQRVLIEPAATAGEAPTEDHSRPAPPAATSGGSHP